MISSIRGLALFERSRRFRHRAGLLQSGQQLPIAKNALAWQAHVFVN
jgi:hypothetical protein